MIADSLTPATRKFLWIAALIVLTAAVYWPVLGSEFVGLDDDVYVWDNRRVSEGLTLRGLTWALSTLEAAFWQPVTWLSHMLDVELFGLDPAGHHGVNLLLHLINVALLFRVLDRLTGQTGPSLAVASLFALHPLNVESVAWVAERKNVLSTLFWLLTVDAYGDYVRQPARRRYLLVLLWFVLGLAAKPMLVTLPVILVMLDYWPLKRLQDSAARLPVLFYEKMPMLLLALSSGLLAVAAQHRAGALADLESLSFPARLENGVVSTAAYLGKMVWPSGLAVFYPYPAHGYPCWQLLVSLLVLLAVSALAAWAVRLTPALLIGWLWYLVALAPVSGLVQVGFHARADRYAYVPLIGVFVLLVWGSRECLYRSNLRPRIWAAAAVLLLALLCLNTRRQVRYWQNDLTLFGHAIRSTRNNLPARTNLGTALLERGRVEDAMEQFREAIRIRPTSARAHYNLGLAFMKQEKPEQAGASFETALQLDPALAAAHNNLGKLQLEQGRLAEAREHFRRALSLEPRMPQALDNLGTALAREGRVDEAVGYFRRSAQADPGRASAQANLGAALDMLGDREAAMRHYRLALDLDGRFFMAHYNLGLLLAERGTLEESARHMNAALEIRPDFVDGHYTLGRVRIEQGMRDEAAACFRRVLDLDPGHEGARRHLEELEATGRNR